MINVICAKDYADVSRKAAAIIASVVTLKPDCVLGLATGSSPIGTYKELIAKYEAGILDFSQVKTVNLDEYVGLSKDHDQSYAYFMRTNLFDHINIDQANCNIPSGLTEDPESECAAYDELIAELNTDLQLLGMGPNGHIGFNEPGTPFGSLTHIVELTESTREANKRFFKSIEEVPTHAVTMGVKTVMQARSIILMAIGPAKAPIMKEMLQGPVTEKVPASVLQLHPDVTVYMDYEAAKML